MGGIDLRDRSVIELGAGTGLLGIVATLLGKGCFVCREQFTAVVKLAFLHPHAEVHMKATHVNCDIS